MFIDVYRHIYICILSVLLGCWLLLCSNLTCQLSMPRKFMLMTPPTNALGFFRNAIMFLHTSRKCPFLNGWQMLAINSLVCSSKGNILVVWCCPALNQTDAQYWKSEVQPNSPSGSDPIFPDSSSERHLSVQRMPLDSSLVEYFAQPDITVGDRLRRLHR